MKKCTCGCFFFEASQSVGISQDIIVDGNDEFVSDMDGSFDVIDVEPPAGPYTCIKCGKKYDDITILEDTNVSKKDYEAQKAMMVDERAAEKIVKNLSPRALLLAHMRYRRCETAGKIREYFKRLQREEEYKGKTLSNEDFEDLAEEFEQEYDDTLSDEDQYKRIIKRRFD